MTLQELNNLNQTADQCEIQAKRLEGIARSVANKRNESMPLIKYLRGPYDAHVLDETRVYIANVADEFSAEIYRLTEMRLAAEARKFKVRAKTLRQMIDAAIVQEGEQ